MNYQNSDIFEDITHEIINRSGHPKLIFYLLSIIISTLKLYLTSDIVIK